MINRTATTVHQYLVILWLAGLAVTVFLAGLGVFEVTTTSTLGSDNSTKLVSADDLDPHRIAGSLLVVGTLLDMIAAGWARASRRQIGHVGGVLRARDRADAARRTRQRQRRCLRRPPRAERLPAHRDRRRPARRRSAGHSERPDSSADCEAIELGREPGIRDADRAGARDRDPALRDQARDRRRSDAVVAMGVDAAPAQACGDAWITQPLRVTRTCPPTARRSSPTDSRRFDSFTASSSAPRTMVVPRARQAASAISGSSSTIDGMSLGSISHATSSDGRTSRSATGSPPGSVRRLNTVMRAPMRSSTVREADAGGVRRDPAQEEARLQRRHRRSEERRGPLGSDGTVMCSSARRCGGPDRDLAAPPLDPHARVAQEALGVVAGGDRAR